MVVVVSDLTFIGIVRWKQNNHSPFYQEYGATKILS